MNKPDRKCIFPILILFINVLVCSNLLGEKLNLQNFYKYRNISRPFWNQDSTKLAFTVSEGGTGKTTLYLANAADGKLKILLESNIAFTLLNDPWSEKENHLYIMRGLSVYEFNEANKKERIILKLNGYNKNYLPQVYYGDFPPYGSLSPILSPDRSKLAYSWQSEIYVCDIGKGGFIQVTQLHPEGWHCFDPKWSPDSKSILFTAVETESQNPFVFPTFGKIMGFRQALIGLSDVRVGVIPYLGGETVWMAPDMESKYSIRGGSVVHWSPDGSEILINKISLDHTKREIITADPKNGKAKIIYSEEVPYWISPMAVWVRYAPDGEKILFTSEKTGWNHIFTKSLNETDPEQITFGEFTVMSNQVYDGLELIPVWSRDGRNIYFPSNKDDTASRNLYVIPSDGGDSIRLTHQEGVNSQFVLSPDEKYVAYFHSDLAQPQELYLIENRTDAKPIKLTNLFLPEELSDCKWVEKEVIKYRNLNDGMEISALLYYPKNFQENKKYPLIVFAHGAGYSQTVYKGNWGERFLFNEYLAQQGYLVLAPDFRGSSGYGKKFRNDVHNQLGFVDLDDIVFGVKYLEKLDFVDEGKIAIWGHSYGGFMTCMAMFRADDVFKAGASSAPVTDWERFFYLAPGYNEEHLGFPWENPEGTKKCSPLYYVENLENPFLLLSGMQDLMHLDAEVLVIEMLKHRKRFEMVFYPLDHHSMSTPTTIEDKYWRIFNFFQRNIKGN